MPSPLLRSVWSPAASGEIFLFAAALYLLTLSMAVVVLRRDCGFSRVFFLFVCCINNFWPELQQEDKSELKTKVVKTKTQQKIVSFRT